MSNGIKEEFEDIKHHFVEKIADNMHTFGVSSTVVRVLGNIYTNRKLMTLNEQSEATGMSKMHMSQVI